VLKSANNETAEAMIPAFQAKTTKRLTYREKVQAGLVDKKPRQRIKPASEHLGTQAEVAAMLGVNRVTVAKREGGTMTITNEAVLAIQSLRRPRRKRKSENA